MHTLGPGGGEYDSEAELESWIYRLRNVQMPWSLEASGTVGFSLTVSLALWAWLMVQWKDGMRWTISSLLFTLSFVW